MSPANVRLSEEIPWQRGHFSQTIIPRIFVYLDAQQKTAVGAAERLCGQPTGAAQSNGIRGTAEGYSSRSGIHGNNPAGAQYRARHTGLDPARSTGRHRGLG